MLTGHDLEALAIKVEDDSKACIEDLLTFQASLDKLAMTHARLTVNMYGQFANMAIDGLATMSKIISATRRRSPDTSDEHHQALLPQASNQQRQPTGEKLPPMKKTG